MAELSSLCFNKGPVPCAKAFLLERGGEAGKEESEEKGPSGGGGGEGAGKNNNHTC